MSPQDSQDVSVGTIDETCDDCGIVVYEVPYSDDRGTGYLTPEYCPMCGGEL